MPVENDTAGQSRWRSLDVHAEIIVRLDEAQRRYRYSTPWYERLGGRYSTEKSNSRLRRIQYGAYLTFDGVQLVTFDTKLVYSAIDAALAQLGWRY